MYACGIWNGDIFGRGQCGVGKDGRIRNPRWETQCKGSVNAQNGESFLFPIADGTVKLSGGDQVLRTSTLIRDSPERGEEREDLQGESDGSPPQDSLPCDGEARNGFWSISGNYSYRHHVDPRVKLYVPREEAFPIPLRFFDVVRTTSTTLDVMLERRIDDNWSIEGDQDLSDAWTGFTRFTILKNLQTGIHGSGRAADKEANNIQVRDHLWPERSSTQRKHIWAIEKAKLGNAQN